MCLASDSLRTVTYRPTCTRIVLTTVNSLCSTITVAGRTETTVVREETASALAVNCELIVPSLHSSFNLNNVVVPIIVHRLQSYPIYSITVGSRIHTSRKSSPSAVKRRARCSQHSWHILGISGRTKV